MPSNSTLFERFYHLENNLSTHVTCTKCKSKKPEFINMGKGYKNLCKKCTTQVPMNLRKVLYSKVLDIPTDLYNREMFRFINLLLSKGTDSYDMNLELKLYLTIKDFDSKEFNNWIMDEGAIKIQTYRTVFDIKFNTYVDNKLSYKDKIKEFLKLHSPKCGLTGCKEHVNKSNGKGVYKLLCEKCEEGLKKQKHITRYIIYKYFSDETLKFSEIKNIIKALELNESLVYIINKIKTLRNNGLKNISYYDRILQIRNELTSSDSSSNRYIQLYYNENKWNEVKNKIEYRATKQYQIDKYGEVEGSKRWNESCAKKSHSLENCILRHGEEKGLQFYQEFVKLQKHNSTKEFLQTKWGEEYEHKSKIRSNTTIEYYISKGHSTAEAENIRSQRQSTFNKEKCIETYGTEEGLKVWKERQDKWQETLNSKTQAEIEEINIKKGSTYFVLIETFHYTHEEAIHTLKQIDIPMYKKYTSMIDKLSQKTYEEYIDEIDSDRLRGKKGTINYDLDHKVSRTIGFIFNIDPKII